MVCDNMRHSLPDVFEVNLAFFDVQEQATKFLSIEKY